VVLVGPPKPPSPVPEGVEEPNSPATLSGYRDAPSSNGGAAGAGVANASGASLRDQLGAAQEDKAEIRRRLELLEERPAGRSVAAGGGAATQQVRCGCTCQLDHGLASLLFFQYSRSCVHISFRAKVPLL
jgi:hypothetical protein